MSEVLVAARDLEREYRVGPETVRVLRGVTLAVGAGESVALIGASGVGESALARLRRTEIAFIFQFYNLLGEMTALENAMMPALLQRLPTLQARERGAAALHEVGLGDRLAHRPGELSGGEQQRVAIARALVAEPRLVLADEPTGNLDPKTSEVIWELFLKLQAERGLAFIVATHNHDLARKADHGYRLVEGRAIAWS
jgi:lipoprotein-releasing system ATP-binding protein